MLHPSCREGELQTLISCMQCLVDDGLPNFSSLKLERIPDDGVIDLQCERGHHTFVVLQEAKFEILAEIAVTALGDGYYREAVASFAASLERLYEFYVQIVCRTHSIDRAAFEATWKRLKKQSERQLGAFCALYLLEAGEAPVLLPDRQVAFRNEVIHQGRIPSREEAVTYGQAVADCVATLLGILNSPRYAEAARDNLVDRLRQRAGRARKAGARSSTASIDTPFMLGRPAGRIDIEAILAERAARPDIAEAVRQSHALGRLIDGLRRMGAVASAKADGGCGGEEPDNARCDR